jgi:archaellum component FlaG (FlaF/FlaG flagellin family)
LYKGNNNGDKTIWTDKTQFNVVVNTTYIPNNLITSVTQNGSNVDIVIDTEANKNGFIDFNAQMAAFKIQTVGLQNINR